jgi:hypothetical protein
VPRSRPPREDLLSGLVILVVEDDPDSCDLLAE